MRFHIDNIPDFMLDRAILYLENTKEDIDRDISQLKAQKHARDIRKKQELDLKNIVTELLINHGENIDDRKMRQVLCEHGHSWEYAGKIIETHKKEVEAQYKALEELEIWRRHFIGKERKTALAKEYGLSRATIERTCKRLTNGAEGLKGFAKLHKAIIFNSRAKKKEQAVTPALKHK